MPLTLNQLKAKLRRDPEQFRKDQQKLMAFSKTLYTAYQALARGNKVDRQLSNRVRDFSEAFEALSRDLTDPQNQDKLESALTTLADFGDFLGQRDEPFSSSNVCMRIRELPRVDDHLEVVNGLRTFNEFFDFGVDVESLTSGTVDEPTEEEKRNRKLRLDAWKAQRELEQLEAKRERELAEARERARQDEENKRLAEEAAKRRQEQEKQEEQERLEELGRKVLEEEERARKEKEEREQKEKEERIRQEEERLKQEKEEPAKEDQAAQPEQKDAEQLLRENQKRVDQQIRQAQERAAAEAMARAAAEAAERTRQIALQAQLRTSMETSLSAARDPRSSDRDRKYNLALALAIHRELKDVPADGSVPISTDDVNETMQRLHDSAAFTIAERQGRLNELAAEPLDSLDQKVRTTQQAVDRCETAADFGLRMNRELQHAPDAEAQGVAYTRDRAGQIFAQMNSTWRFAGNSDQYVAARQAIREIGDKNPPTQLDHYLAGETVKAYVAKNLQQAESAVGMTRMACAMAFLKQTMTEADFRLYCANLNAQRRIRQDPPNSLNFDKTELRCFVPDEIGTVREVYNTVRERFFHLYDEETGYKAPDPRDLAMLTALKNLQARAGGNENFVVEHEALQKEIQKVQADRRFQDALKNRSAHELIEMAGGHNLDTINGYAQELRPEQRDRVQQELDRLAAKEADRIAREEQAKRDKEEADRRAKEEADRREAERQRQERERLQKEKERAEFLKTHVHFDQVLKEEVLPSVKKLAEPNLVKNVFEELYGPEENYTELTAKMVALAEFAQKSKQQKEQIPEDKRGYLDREQLKQRVEQLKNDPEIKKLGAKLRDDPETQKTLKEYREEYKEKGQARDAYVAFEFARKVKGDYEEALDAIDRKTNPKRWPTVQKCYKAFEKDVGAIASGGIGGGCKKAAEIAAKMVALRELETANAQGLDTPVNQELLIARAKEIYKDPLLTTIGQNLVGPGAELKLARAFNMTTNREQTFAEYVTKMYNDLKLQREQKQQKQQNPEKQPKLEDPNQQNRLNEPKAKEKEHQADGIQVGF